MFGEYNAFLESADAKSDGVQKLKTKVAPGPGKVGLVVKGFVPSENGEPGPVERHGVRVGMVLSAIDDVDVSGMFADDVLAEMRQRAKQSKVVTFAMIVVLLLA